jgi:hypothetical protein
MQQHFMELIKHNSAPCNAAHSDWRTVRYQHLLRPRPRKGLIKTTTLYHWDVSVTFTYAYKAEHEHAITDTSHWT